jgi:hypothetical protein
MRRLLFACLYLMTSLQAETKGMKWARRAITAAACATSALDGYDSATYLGHNGLHEGNAFLANQSGTVRMGPMIALKAGLCVGAAIAGELHGPTGTAVSASELGLFTAVDIHNSLLVRKDR